MSEATATIEARERTAGPAVSPRWLIAAVLLTLVDAVATAVWIEAGVAIEGNPLLAPLVDSAGAVPAMMVRAFVGVGLLVLLARLAPASRLARVALPGVATVLGAVAAWHAFGLIAFV